MKLTLFSGGAAKAVVGSLQPAFESAHGCTLDASFDAVGALRDRLLAGAPCDLVLLSAALIEQLAQQGHVVAASVRPLGRVATGIALPDGAPAVAVDSSEALKKVLEAASGLYVPDLRRSSAGIHVAKVLAALGLTDALADRIHEHPNGATAMRELARDGAPGAIGCTQATEILYTTGVRLLAELPAEHALDTVYSAAVCTRAQQPELAARFVAMLAGDASAALRERWGFRV